MSEHETRGGPPEPRRTAAVGAPVRRVDASDKVTGRAVYLDDMVVPGVLHAALVFPGCAHAVLRGVDASAARSMAGVRSVLTADDIPGENQVGVIDADQPLLPFDRIRYEGDAVAIVVAETAALAREAADTVSVDLTELPGVFDAVRAMEPDAPLVHENGNVFLHDKVRKGDIDAGFDAADIIVEREFRTYHQEHCYLEPLAALAVPADNGSMTVYGTMQCPFYVQKAVAGVLGLPLASVRVIQTVTGGGFGGKEDAPSEICACAALAAWKTGSAVKLVYSREEDFLRSSKRHPMHVRFKLGVRRDGTFTAAKIRAVADAGAYSTLTPVVAFRAAAHATGPYEIPNVSTDVYGVYTNRQTTGAFRGFGQPQVIFADESVIDEVADAIGMDPVDIRLLNCLDVGKRTATNQLLTESVGLRETLELARELSGWDELRQSSGRTLMPRGHVLRGVGVGSIYYGVSLGAKGLALDGSGAHINVYRDGSVRIGVGGAEMGQGLLTVLSQIAADSLGVPVDSIHVERADTSVVPDSGPSVASRTTLMTGNAVIDAARKLLAVMGEVAADLLGINTSEVEFGSGTVGSAEANLTFAELAEQCWVRNVRTAADGWYAAPESTFDENGQGDAYAVYSYATHVAEVEVDTETGRVSVVRVTAAHDVGRVLNPVTLEGQIEGGVLQGIGMALYEQMKTEGGAVVTPDFSTYIIPTAMDAPEILTAFVEHPYSRGPFGAKGIGETPAMPGAVAVANAVSNALGVRFSELPLTPERVREAVSKRKDL
ncbi:MAG: xanthine dehydrogenase family protein [Candidatus Eisenbacteria sp.]|nr:xanthine dehydrogenase family protein [Candidatus Eisenbacteria bacterium]